MSEVLKAVGNVPFAFALLGSSGLFVTSSVLLKSWQETKSLFTLLLAYGAIAIANVLYAQLLAQNFSRGYLLSATCCLIGSLSAGYFIYHENFTTPRLCAGACFIIGVGFLCLPTSKG